MKKYVYIKWKCRECGDIVISNKFRHHQMDFCKCGKTGVDLETYQLRMSGFPDEVERYNYNFFDELVICLKEQELLELNLMNQARKDGRITITLQEVVFIRQMEDEICGGLI